VAPLAWVRREWDVLASIALGGGVGASARYLAGQWIGGSPPGFPTATFVINVSGCLLLGVLMVFVSDVWRPGRYARPLVGIGILGAFTTYSTAMLDAHALADESRWLVAAGYLMGSVLSGLAGLWLGMMGTRAVTGFRVRRRNGRETPKEAA
jgi:protein CrcB